MNLQEKYDILDGQKFDLMFYEIYPYIYENHMKISDWSGLWFNYFDHKNEIMLKYGPKRSFPIPQIEEHMNQDRTPIKSLKIGFEEDTDVMDSLTVNGLHFYILSEDLAANIAGYIYKKLN